MNVSSASSSYVHPLSHVSLKFKLTRNERRHLDRFVRETKDNKEEYARGTAILMRWRGKKEKRSRTSPESSTYVCMGAVFR